MKWEHIVSYLVAFVAGIVIAWAYMRSRSRTEGFNGSCTRCNASPCTCSMNNSGSNTTVFSLFGGETAATGATTPTGQYSCPKCPPVPDMSKYVLRTTIPPCPPMPDMTKYMLRSECPPPIDLTRYVLKTSIPKPVPCISTSCSVPKVTCPKVECAPCPACAPCKATECPPCPTVQVKPCPTPDVKCKPVVDYTSVQAQWPVRPMLAPLGLEHA